MYKYIMLAAAQLIFGSCPLQDTRVYTDPLTNVVVKFPNYAPISTDIISLASYETIITNNHSKEPADAYRGNASVSDSIPTRSFSVGKFDVLGLRPAPPNYHYLTVVRPRFVEITPGNLQIVFRSLQLCFTGVLPSPMENLLPRQWKAPGVGIDLSKWNSKNIEWVNAGPLFKYYIFSCITVTFKLTSVQFNDPAFSIDYHSGFMCKNPALWLNSVAPPIET